MKNLLLTTAVLFGLTAFSQTNVSLEIVHKLGGEDFSYTQTADNNLGQEVTVSRFEYYLSGFAITHDGGEVTQFSDLYLLGNATENALVNFDQVDAENIEMLTFYIGVDYEANHADPALWPSEHPLAPQFPSMHWGWASGYRFLAMEGSENETNQNYELHGLGDGNYLKVELPLDISLSSEDLTIEIQANVEEALYNIDLNGGIFIHGAQGAAQEALDNMQERVFEVTGSTLGVNDASASTDFTLFPNPTTDNSFQVQFAPIAGSTYRLQISDIRGKLILAENMLQPGSQVTVSSLEKGVYVVSLIAENGTISTRKLVIR